MNRRKFVYSSALLTAGMLANSSGFAASNEFPIVRVEPGKRKFQSQAIENAIKQFRAGVKNKETGWLFENCFPNTLDTTVAHSVANNIADTYVITGDIDAMWLRDSSAQVWPYLAFMSHDAALQQLVAGVINRQARCILKDPYANAFYDDDTKQGEWKVDLTDMKPGVHERKWEIDSLCYPIRLAYNYWKLSGDAAVFNQKYKEALQTIFKTFKEQQHKEDDGPYKFQRNTAVATDTRTMNGYGYPVNPVGLVCSAFRPSDDATVFSFLIPSNFFAVKSLQQAAEISSVVYKDRTLAGKLNELASEIKGALQKHAIVQHPVYGKVYAFEVDGFGGTLLMDDANIPSLLAMPYLGTASTSDPVYINTRKMVLSKSNPFFYKGKAAEGIGGPHVGKDMIWPMSIIIRGMTSRDDKEIASCIETLRKTHANTGFMHESFNKDDPSKFTRSWFAWANTLFGEFLWKTWKERPYL
ncbi:MAG: glycoside hydrolase family 125 protein, partial [Ferruginibacter sp.]